MFHYTWGPNHDLINCPSASVCSLTEFECDFLLVYSKFHSYSMSNLTQLQQSSLALWSRKQVIYRPRLELKE